jgi:hypothetical protein
MVKYEGEERRQQSWHLEKSISIGHIITTLTVAASVFLWASNTETRITLLEREALHAKEQNQATEQYVRESVSRIEASIIRMEDIMRGKADK